MTVQRHRLTAREVMEIVVPRMVEALGRDRVRAIHQRVLAQLGEGGSAADWLRAWADILTADGDVPGTIAMLVALEEIKART